MGDFKINVNPHSVAVYDFNLLGLFTFGLKPFLIRSGLQWPLLLVLNSNRDLFVYIYKPKAESVLKLIRVNWSVGHVWVLKSNKFWIFFTK